ncbi:MAG: hypothetical protein ACLTBZ_00255 [Faecalispora jeddahensis]|jgi:hypothetical protein|nr:hypothetical protein [Oscillospiraceae bacterium]MBS5784196.1 hypothetical protein [Clostridium sp.]
MQSNQSNQANEKQLLLNLLAQRLGKSPDEIMQYAENGNLPALMQNMNPNDAAALQKVLNDQQAIQKLISSPQAQDLMRRLNGQK